MEKCKPGEYIYFAYYDRRKQNWSHRIHWLESFALEWLYQRWLADIGSPVSSDFGLYRITLDGRKVVRIEKSIRANFDNERISNGKPSNTWIHASKDAERLLTKEIEQALATVS